MMRHLILRQIELLKLDKNVDGYSTTALSCEICCWTILEDLAKGVEVFRALYEILNEDNLKVCGDCLHSINEDFYKGKYE